MESTQSLPLAVRYGITLPVAVSGQSTMSRFDSVNGQEFAFGSASQEIRINVSSPSFLLGSESYLQFEIANADATNAAKFMGSANDCIESLRIESNGVELERIDGYNMITTILKRYTSVSDTTTQIFEGAPLRSSDAAAVIAGNSTIKAATSRTFCIRLNSGFLSGGSLRKALPLIGTGGFTMVLRLATVADAFCQVKNADGAQATASIGAGNLKMVNPRFYAPCFQIDDAGFGQRYSTMLNSMGIEWSGVTSKRYTNQLQAVAGPTQTVLQLNDRSLSLRGFVTAMRPYSENEKNNSFLTDMSRVTRYRYLISGQEMPLGGIDYKPNAAGRAYFESLKLFGSMANADSNISYSTFTGTGFDTNGAANVDCSLKYTLGTACVDLKKYGDNNLNLTGLNTAMSTVPSTVEIYTEAIAATTRIDTFAIVDVVYRLDQNGSFSSVY